MDGEKILAALLLVAIVVVVEVFQAAVLIFALNGLFQVTGYEAQIPYTLNSLCYSFLLIMSLKGGGSSKK